MLERTPIRGVAVHADGAALELGTQSVHARLVVDCMGHRSPIALQVAIPKPKPIPKLKPIPKPKPIPNPNPIALQQRAGQRPDGVCVQVANPSPNPAPIPNPNPNPIPNPNPNPSPSQATSRRSAVWAEAASPVSVASCTRTWGAFG